MDEFFLPFLAGVHENDLEELGVIVLHLSDLALLGFGDDDLVDRAGIQAENFAPLPVFEEDLRQEIAPLLIGTFPFKVKERLRIRIEGERLIVERLPKKGP